MIRYVYGLLRQMMMEVGTTSSKRVLIITSDFIYDELSNLPIISTKNKYHLSWCVCQNEGSYFHLLLYLLEPKKSYVLSAASEMHDHCKDNSL